MRALRRSCATCAVVLLVLAPSLQAATPAATTSRELVDLGVRPASVSVAADGSGFAAVYDDRLTANALRFAERVDGRWTADDRRHDARRTPRGPRAHARDLANRASA